MLSARVSTAAAELAAILLLSLFFLHAAWWNGFPFVFFDTGAYMLEGFGRLFVPERSSVYSIFLDLAGGRQSLWFIAGAQSLMTGFVLTEFARAVRPQTSLMELLGVGAVLALFTSIAWFTGQIEPDCMTPLLALAIFLLAFRTRKLGIVRGAALVAVAGFAIGCHPSHLGLASGLVLAIVNLRFAAVLLRRRVKLPRPRMLLPVLSIALGLGLVLSANYALTHKVFISRSGSIFLSARLMGDGIVKPVLDEICPTRKLQLCPYKDYLPKSADEYLWGPYTPFNKMGRFYGPQQDESKIIVAESLKRYPLTSLVTGLWASLRQFLMVRTGDGISPQEWVLNPGFAHFMPWQSERYLAARQQEGLLRFEAVNVVHVPLAYLSLIWLGWALRSAVKRKLWDRASLPAFVFLALLGNALVCGLFSGPHDRYQSRIVWIVPFVLLVTQRPWIRGTLPFKRGTRGLRRGGESGT